MSRGHGAVEKAILRHLRAYETSAEAAALARTGRVVSGLDVLTLAGLVYGRPATRWFRLISKAQEVAVRRALANLKRQNLVVGPLRLYRDEELGGWRFDVASHPIK
jgi:hypothetical protein